MALEHALAVVEVNEPAQIERIVHVRVGGVELHEPVDRGDCLGRLIRLVVAVRELQLCLRGVRAEGIARLQFLVVIDSAIA